MNKSLIKDRINNLHEIGLELIDLLDNHEMLTESEKWLTINKIQKYVNEAEEELFKKEKENTIYTVTTIRIDGNSKRTPGWFPTFKEAEDIVLNNDMNIFENYYHFVVIEEVEAGLYNFGRRDVRTEIWYRWNNEKQSYENIPKPERFIRTIGWSIG